jgi:aspartyl-tRNA(Asn)/glutamyl-tRNA(Gln) amidotransferase subunit C
MSDTKITPDVIDHVAKLARLKLTPEEKSLYTQQLEPVLDHIDHLNQVNTDVVVPTFQIVAKTNCFRQDEIMPSLSKDKAISTAPKTHQGYITGPKSLDK